MGHDGQRRDGPRMDRTATDIVFIIDSFACLSSKAVGISLLGLPQLAKEYVGRPRQPYEALGTPRKCKYHLSNPMTT